MTELSGAVWRTSIRSGGGGSSDCVAVADNLPGVVAVRDSKNPDGPVLVFSRAEWAAFVGAVKDGEID
jgi:hypothetical protein